jgi:long-chain acyl-CoA synthetase
VRFALAEDQEQVDKVLDLRENGAIIAARRLRRPARPGRYKAMAWQSWEQLLRRRAARLRNEPPARDALIDRAGTRRPGGVRALVGHHGQAQGRGAEHRNVLAGVRNAYQGKAFGFGETSWPTCRWPGSVTSPITMAAGVALRFTINIPERSETVLHDLREIAPTFYLAAPRSWDNMLTTIQVRMADSTPLKKASTTTS